MRKLLFFSVTSISVIFILFNSSIVEKVSSRFNKTIYDIKINNIENLQEDYILSNLRIKKGDSFWTFNSRKLKNDLKEIKEVENFFFNLNSTGLLEISIEERKPHMVWIKSDRLYYLDENGNILNFSKYSFSNLTEIRGSVEKKKLKEFNKAAKKYDFLSKKVSKIFYSQNIGWKVYLFDRKCLFLPEKEIGKILGIFNKIMDSEIYNKYNYFDMRILGRIYLNNESKCLSF